MMAGIDRRMSCMAAAGRYSPLRTLSLT
jgi:hypothetical protein